MTGKTKYATHFLFNLGRSASNGESTISKMYQRVLPIYWAEISKDALSYKTKTNQNDLHQYQKARHICCDEIDIYYLDIGQF